MKNQISLQEDFVFGSVMSNRKLCQHLIQLILPELKISHIKFPTLQKAVQEDPRQHGVRFDVYTEDQNGVYEIDMQVRHTKGLAKRVRYYQSRIDGDLLNHGEGYELMKRSYVIFICPFDPYGKGLHKYEFRNLCVHDHKIEMMDGRTAIFLNTKGITNDVSKALQNFLHYVDNKEVENDQYVDELHDYIQQLCQNTKWRHDYMDNKTHMMFHDEDVRAEGINIGKKVGRQEGENSAIKKMIAMTRQLGVPEDQLRQKVQAEFHLSDQEVAKLFADK
ncbi:MAG TPA: Rpn family recombination-promoting nuclease/putative transposase [Limosilactobacillus coleohominis]|nr:Rpn family recombination-promoting nuclease/putative transposase [Limosilactobacillus coleohominis]